MECPECHDLCSCEDPDRFSWAVDPEKVREEWRREGRLLELHTPWGTLMILKDPELEGD